MSVDTLKKPLIASTCFIKMKQSNRFFIVYVWAILAVFSSCANRQASPLTNSANKQTSNKLMETHNLNPSAVPDSIEIATLGGGCFWCLEAVYQSLEGVLKVESGYMGGTIKNPSYKEVCTGKTGHAEVVQVSFNPNQIGFKDILEVFWHIHDPTTLNRQGNDVGSQYRSAIFYHSPEQKAIAEQSKSEISLTGLWLNPLVTEITSASDFFKAEDYHQNYFSENPDQPYCVYVVNPKLEKFKKQFKNRLKEDIAE